MRAHGGAIPTRAPTTKVFTGGLASEINLLCLWAVVGLGLSAVLLALGFGQEVTQALASGG